MSGNKWEGSRRVPHRIEPPQGIRCTAASEINDRGNSRTLTKQIRNNMCFTSNRTGKKNQQRVFESFYRIWAICNWGKNLTAMFYVIVCIFMNYNFTTTCQYCLLPTSTNNSWWYQLYYLGGL